MLVKDMIARVSNVDNKEAARASDLDKNAPNLKQLLRDSMYSLSNIKRYI